MPIGTVKYMHYITLITPQSVYHLYIHFHINLTRPGLDPRTGDRKHIIFVHPIRGFQRDSVPLESFGWGMIIVYNVVCPRVPGPGRQSLYRQDINIIKKHFVGQGLAPAAHYQKLAHNANITRPQANITAAAALHFHPLMRIHISLIYQSEQQNICTI